jgi:hypothetical protein
MPSVRWVERQIQRVEGFRVAFLHPDGRNVRGDLQDVPVYGFERQLPGERTVSEWTAIRVHQQYRGFDVAVLHRDGSRAHGNTLLATLRAEYAA